MGEENKTGGDGDRQDEEGEGTKQGGERNSLLCYLKEMSTGKH